MKRKNFTDFIFPAILTIAGCLATIYTNEIKQLINNAFAEIIIAIGYLLTGAGIVVLIVAYINRFVWKPNLQVYGQIYDEIASVRELLNSQNLTNSTMIQAFTAYINGLDDSSSIKVADEFLKNQISIEQLEKIGIKQSLIILLKQKYHEQKAEGYKSIIRFNQ